MTIEGHGMPEPTGEYAKVPQGWPPQTWGMHLARIEFLEAMGNAHYSFTDPKRHVRMFEKRIKEECAKIAERWLGCGDGEIAAAIADTIRKSSEKKDA